MKGSDDDVLAGDRVEVEGPARLIGQVEGRHRDEPSRELAQAQVHVVIAGVDGPGDQPAGLDAQKHRLDLAAFHLDPHRLRLVADAYAVVDAGGDRDLEQLALVGRRRHFPAYAADGRPRSSKANREIDRGQRRRGPPRRDHHQRARVGLESRHAPQHDHREDGKQCRANPEKTSPRGQSVSCSGVPP